MDPGLPGWLYPGKLGRETVEVFCEVAESFGIQPHDVVGSDGAVPLSSSSSLKLGASKWRIVIDVWYEAELFGRQLES